MKKLISLSSLVLAAGLLLSACSAKSFTLSNIKRHLTGEEAPTPTVVAPVPTTVVTPKVTVKPVKK